MRTCIYCLRKKEDSEFSKEHIIPVGLIGQCRPEESILSFDVCKRCNNNSGLFIDGPFIKSIFTNQNQFDLYKNFSPSQKNTYYTYVGLLDDCKWEDKICECWITPTTDRVYHFHDPYPAEDYMPSIIGPPPTAYNRNDIDKGFVILVLTTNNPVWFPSLFVSLAERFKGTTLYVANMDGKPIKEINDLPEKLIPLAEKLMALREHHAFYNVDINFAGRFLAKTALGFGAKYLLPSFLDSENYYNLKRYMWERDPAKRAGIEMYGKNNLFAQNKPSAVDQFIEVKESLVVALSVINNSVFFYLNFFGNLQSSLIKITDKTEHIPDTLKKSMILIIVPRLEKIIGPFSQSDFLAHKTGIQKNTDLVALEDELNRPIEMPPFRI